MLANGRRDLIRCVKINPRNLSVTAIPSQVIPIIWDVGYIQLVKHMVQSLTLVNTVEKCHFP